jgi:uncharacterized membrane protein YphA (DoxX/SURF4 family)
MTNNPGSERVRARGAGLHYPLWSIQVLLAALFIFSGVMKFVMPVAKMQQGPVVLPGALLHFIGCAEILGGLGLVLPGWTGIQRKLTPLAAVGLLVIMVGATVITLEGGGGATAALPFIVGVLVAFVAWGRWKWLRG